MKNDAEGVAMPGAKPADAVSKIYAVFAATPLDRTMMNRKNDAISLAKRDDDGARLRPGPLFRHHEFPSFKILFRLRKQEGHL